MRIRTNVAALIYLLPYLHFIIFFAFFFFFFFVFFFFFFCSYILLQVWKSIARRSKQLLSGPILRSDSHETSVRTRRRPLCITHFCFFVFVFVFFYQKELLDILVNIEQER